MFVRELSKLKWITRDTQENLKLTKSQRLTLKSKPKKKGRKWNHLNTNRWLLPAFKSPRQKLNETESIKAQYCSTMKKNDKRNGVRELRIIIQYTSLAFKQTHNIFPFPYVYLCLFGRARAPATAFPTWKIRWTYKQIVKQTRERIQRNNWFSRISIKTPNNTQIVVNFKC